MTIDLHVHTSRGSADSNIDPFALIDQARNIGLNGLCITEHNNVWTDRRLDCYARKRRVLLFRGMEVTTEFGHVGVFGLRCYVAGIFSVRKLRRVTDEMGGFLIANHPFRYRLDLNSRFLSQSLPLDQTDPALAAQAIELFKYVDAIEAVNGACSKDENRFAAEAAKALGYKVVGGSDSHRITTLGSAATIFERNVLTSRALLNELKEGRYHATAL